MPESDHLYERLYNMMVEAYTDHILERSIKSTGRIRGRGWVQKEVRQVFCYHSLWPARSVHYLTQRKLLIIVNHSSLQPYSRDVDKERINRLFY